ncbi:hypothetical protein FNV43_RR12058 [Rhamnella rubrinervis]|uniref:Uncharacterized protein n=1 Tax=Rhamnella rubrinervis TaxID=2594499 RepID=A0A8K0H7M8_9ROSA|nr:hypothetical protein FNV43_RR12058 [Rhamnella rubrinervis]
MVGVFRRSLSFPNKINPNRPSKPLISHHIRSISLPCRSHPLISQLKDGISELYSWASKPDTRTSAWLCDGLNRLKDLLYCLDDMLQLPQTQESLRRQPYFVESLLEDFLRFVDVYGIFQTSILAFKEEQLAARVAIRKRDDIKITLYVKARKKMAKEMSKLVSSADRCITRPGSAVVCVGDSELADVIGDVVEVTVMVSLSLFNGMAVSLGSRKSTWMGLRLKNKGKKVKVGERIQELQQVGEDWLWSLRKKGDEEVRMTLKKMQEMEICVDGIESGSEKVFRSLINARVSLLNTLTQ